MIDIRHVIFRFEYFFQDKKQDVGELYFTNHQTNLILVYMIVILRKITWMLIITIVLKLASLECILTHTHN